MDFFLSGKRHRTNYLKKKRIQLSGSVRLVPIRRYLSHLFGSRRSVQKPINFDGVLFHLYVRACVCGVCVLDALQHEA